MKLVSSPDDPTINIYASHSHHHHSIELTQISQITCPCHLKTPCIIQALSTYFRCGKVMKPKPEGYFQIGSRIKNLSKSGNVELQWVAFENKGLGFSFRPELEINSFNQRTQLHFHLAICRTMEMFISCK